MESNPTTIMFQQLYELKAQRLWTQCISIGHDIESALLEMPESHNLLECYLELFHLYYVKGDLPKAFNYLFLIEPLLLQFGQWQHYTKFMQSVVKTNIFYARKTEIERFIEHLIPYAFEEEQFEVLSHCFLTQSYIHLAEAQIDLSIQEAKMAYFYAQLVEGEKQSFVLCNAQLQLVLALIEQVALDKAKYYIDYFGWSLTNCEQEQDKVLVTLVQGMIDLLNLKIDETLPQIKAVLLTLSSSQEIMYSTILTRQIQFVLQKVENKIPPLEYEQLLLLCEQITMRHQMQTAIFMENFTTFSSSMLDKAVPIFEQSTNIFNVGQHLFTLAKNEQQLLYCKIMKMNYEQLSKQQQAHFNETLYHSKTLAYKQQLVASQFSRDLVIVLSLVDVSFAKTNIAYFTEYPTVQATAITYNASSNQFSNFHQLFNHLFFKQLLALEFDPYKESLAQ